MKKKPSANIKFMLWWSSKMRALPSTHLQFDPSWAPMCFFPPFTVTTCSCCVLLLWSSGPQRAHERRKTKRRKKKYKQRRRSDEKEEKKRTDITGEICNYVDGTIGIVAVVVNIAHTIKVAGGTRSEEKKENVCYIKTKRKKKYNKQRWQRLHVPIVFMR